MKPNLSVEIAGMILGNPVMNCAGTFEPEEICKDLMHPERLGAVVSKTITFNKRDGNEQPRIFEVNDGIINRIGLQNPGVENFVKEKIFEFVKLGVPLIVSFGGESIKEYFKVATILQEEAGDFITALEANVSCPNVKDGMAFGCEPEFLYELVSKLKAEISLPLIVKLTPNVTDIGLIAKAAQQGGVDAISLINTVRSRAYIHNGPDAGKWIEGGLSGPTIKPIALQKVYEVSKAISLPLIAMGGISNTQDALDFLRIENVWCVAVGTASFREPLTMIKIINGLNEYFVEKGYANWKEFRRKEVYKK